MQAKSLAKTKLFRAFSSFLCIFFCHALFLTKIIFVAITLPVHGYCCRSGYTISQAFLCFVLLPLPINPWLQHHTLPVRLKNRCGATCNLILLSLFFIYINKKELYSRLPLLPGHTVPFFFFLHGWLLWMCVKRRKYQSSFTSAIFYSWF